MGVWQTIDTLPTKRDYDLGLLLAWKDEKGEWYTGEGMRYKDKFYAIGLFNVFGVDRRYQLKELEVSPTHWTRKLSPPEEV